MLSYTILAIILLTISGGYSIYDIFFNRTVPDFFIYGIALISYCIALSQLTTPSTALPLFTLLVPASLMLIGILVNQYTKQKLMGAGDLFLLGSLGFVMPFQPPPLLLRINQFGLPFLLSVCLASMYAIIIYIIIQKFIVKREIPKQLPFAPFILIGVIASLLFGNLLMFLLT